MKLSDIPRLRLRAQRIADAASWSPHDVVAHLGAVQAQDYPAALWGIGLRASVTQSDVERSLAKREIVRSWPLRGTLHIVAAEDLRWMLAHLMPRIAARYARRLRAVDLDGKTLARCERVIARGLGGGHARTRDEIYQLLDRAGIATAAQRGMHILWSVAHTGVICFGPRAGNQHTFVLLDDWLPRARSLPARDEALAALAVRYCDSHGPATAEDFAWWSGLSAPEARAALASVEGRLALATVGGRRYFLSPHAAAADARGAMHLLPAFDEYVVAYKDRDAILDPVHRSKAILSVGLLRPAIEWNGKIIGTWTRTLRGGDVHMKPQPFAPLKGRARTALIVAAQRYAAFLGAKLV